MSELTTEQHRVDPSRIALARTSMYNLFTDAELADIIAAAKERGRSAHGMIKDAILNDLFSSPTWGNDKP